jgi:hypothetical protein
MSKERFSRGRDSFVQAVVLRGATLALWSEHESQETFFTELNDGSWDTVGVLGLHALHIKVSELAVPQYRVAQGGEGNTRTGNMRRIHCGIWVQL